MAQPRPECGEGGADGSLSLTTLPSVRHPATVWLCRLLVGSLKSTLVKRLSRTVARARFPVRSKPESCPSLDVAARRARPRDFGALRSPRGRRAREAFRRAACLTPVCLSVSLTFSAVCPLAPGGPPKPKKRAKNELNSETHGRVSPLCYLPVITLGTWEKPHLQTTRQTDAPPSTLRPQTPWRACNNITTGARNATLSTRDRCRRGAKPPPPSIRPRRRPSRKPFVCLGSGRRGGPHRRCTARGPGTAWAPWRQTA